MSTHIPCEAESIRFEPLTDAQIAQFDEQGYLILSNVMSDEEANRLTGWTKEVKESTPSSGAGYMPYMEIDKQGRRVLTVSENFCNTHKGFNSLIRSPSLLRALNQLTSEEMHLFKEKINFKQPSAGGFSPHLDAPAFAHLAKKPLTVLFVVEDMTVENGCLEVVPGSQKIHVPLGLDNCIEANWVKAQTWVPVPLRTGQVMIFGSYLAHRSGDNHSPNGRAAVYGTYNCASEGGDMHDAYYAHRRKIWPPTHERVEGEKYLEGALLYGWRTITFTEHVLACLVLKRVLKTLGGMDVASLPIMPLTTKHPDFPSSMARVPVEVLLRIFETGCDKELFSMKDFPEDVHAPDNRAKLKNFVVPLSRVCRRWQRVIRNSSSCWITHLQHAQSIHSYYSGGVSWAISESPKVSESNHSSAISNSDINLLLIIGKESGKAIEWLQTQIPHILHRLQLVSIDEEESPLIVTDYLIQSLLASSPDQWPRLKSLMLRSHRGVISFPPETQLRPSSITHLHLYEQAFAEAVSPFGSLTSLTINMSGYNINHHNAVASSCRTLEKLHIKDGQIKKAGLATINPLKLNTLSELHLDCRGFGDRDDGALGCILLLMQKVETPSLSKLSMVLDGAMRPEAPLPEVPREYPSVNTLFIRMGITEFELLFMSIAFPNLVHADLGIREDYRPFTVTIPRPQRAPFTFPSLTNLRIHFCDTLLSMLDLSQVTGSVYLDGCGRGHQRVCVPCQDGHSPLNLPLIKTLSRLSSQYLFDAKLNSLRELTFSVETPEKTRAKSIKVKLPTPSYTIPLWFITTLRFHVPEHNFVKLHPQIFDVFKGVEVLEIVYEHADAGKQPLFTQPLLAEFPRLDSVHFIQPHYKACDDLVAEKSLNLKTALTERKRLGWKPIRAIYFDTMPPKSEEMDWVVAEVPEVSVKKYKPPTGPIF